MALAMPSRPGSPNWPTAITALIQEIPSPVAFPRPREQLWKICLQMPRDKTEGQWLPVAAAGSPIPGTLLLCVSCLLASCRGELAGSCLCSGGRQVPIRPTVLPVWSPEPSKDQYCSLRRKIKPSHHVPGHCLCQCFGITVANARFGPGSGFVHSISLLSWAWPRQKKVPGPSRHNLKGVSGGCHANSPPLSTVGKGSGACFHWDHYELFFHLSNEPNPACPFPFTAHPAQVQGDKIASLASGEHTGQGGASTWLTQNNTVAALHWGHRASSHHPVPQVIFRRGE